MILKNKINLSIGLILVLFIGFLIFAIRPLLLEIKTNSQDFASLQQELALLEIEVKALDEFEDIYQNIKPDLEKADALFVEPEVPVDFISFLEKIAQSCQVVLEISPTFSQKIKEDTWPSIGFQITAMGPFPNFLRSLEKLESSHHLIEVQDLSIAKLGEEITGSKESEGFSPDDVKANFSLKVYTK